MTQLVDILAMQSLFLVPGKEGRLAQSAVCFALTFYISLLATLCVCGALALLPMTPLVLSGLATVVLIGWLWWIILGSIKLVRALRQATQVFPSSQEFDVIQYVFVACMLFTSLFHGSDVMKSLYTGALCAQVFLAAFYIFFILFGLLGKVRIPARSWWSLAVLVGSIILSWSKAISNNADS